jgi:hypothetical protein
MKISEKRLASLVLGFVHCRIGDEKIQDLYKKCTTSGTDHCREACRDSD